MAVSKKFGKFKVFRASALAQSEVLSILSPAVISRWYNQPVEIKDHVKDFLLLFTITLPFETKQKIADLFMENVTEGDETYVDIKTFDGDMMGYHKLLAEIIHWNLNDFFTYIDKEHRKMFKKSVDPV